MSERAAISAGPIWRVDMAAPSEKPLIVATHRIFPETRAFLDRLGTVLAPEPDREALDFLTLSEALPRAAAMMAFMPDRVDDDFLAAAPRLRIIAAALKGYDNFDAAACSRRGVWLTIVPDLLTVPTAELAIGLMIGLARHIAAGDAYIRSGAFCAWRPAFYGRGLAGMTAGLIGMGAIGRGIAERLRPFAMELIYTDPRSLAASEEHALGLTRVTLDGLLARADYVISVAPLSAQTLHFIDEAALARMKPGSLLINPSRGSVVDETAVAGALQSGRLGGYAADVFEMEDWRRADRPRDIPRALRDHPNTLFTPHLGSAVATVRLAIEQRAAENIADLFVGGIPRDAVADLGMPSDRS